MKIDLKELVSEFNSNLKLDYDLKKKNWFNIGGKSKIFFKAKNLKELLKFLKKLNNKEKIFILGAGSNTLITDGIFDGVVIRLSKSFNNGIGLLFCVLIFVNILSICVPEIEVREVSRKVRNVQLYRADTGEIGGGSKR